MILHFAIKLSIYYFISTLLIGFLVFFVNWYVHYSYHHDDCWLQQYDFFKEKTRKHMLHHKNSNINYGITNLYADYFMNTFTESGDDIPVTNLPDDDEFRI